MIISLARRGRKIAAVESSSAIGYILYPVRIIKASTVTGYEKKFPKARQWLGAWVLVVKSSSWSSIADVRKTYRSADRATGASGKPLVIFDVGNHYRLIVAIHFDSQRVYIRDFMTHESYNDQKWKRRH